jgi:hypothetical protein
LAPPVALNLFHTLTMYPSHQLKGWLNERLHEHPEDVIFLLYLFEAAPLSYQEIVVLGWVDPDVLSRALTHQLSLQGQVSADATWTEVARNFLSAHEHAVQAKTAKDKKSN